MAQAARCCCLSLLSGWAPLVRQACSLLLLLLALSRTELTRSSSRGSAATPSFVSVRGGSSPPYHEPSRGPDPGWHWQEMHLPSGPVHLCSVDVHDSLGVTTRNFLWGCTQGCPAAGLCAEPCSQHPAVWARAWDFPVAAARAGTLWSRLQQCCPLVCLVCSPSYSPCFTFSFCVGFLF